MEPSDFYGIYGLNETMCVEHVRDQILRADLSKIADKFQCSFCARKQKQDELAFAVDLDELGTRVWNTLNWLYEAIEVNDDPWGFQDEYDNSYVIFETLEDAIHPEYAVPILERLIAATTSTDIWVPNLRVNPSALGWETYAATVRHESRFVAMGTSMRPGYENEPPAVVGKFLESLLAYVESDLLVELPAGSTLYRGRMTGNAADLLEEARKEPSTLLGPAPPGVTTSSRLSPPGISLFYSADDLRLALAEIALHSKLDQAVMGAFRTTRPLRILDFTRPLTRLPSVFATDDESRQRWLFARFKKHFADMIAAPVLLDGREAVEYTPTQVVAEWLRWVPDNRIDGIAWAPQRKEVGDVVAEFEHVLNGELDGVTAPHGRNIALFFGFGPDFQSLPPTALELARPTQRQPALTLAADDLIALRVLRHVSAMELSGHEEDHDPCPIFMNP